jgi:phosphatidylglycerol:prolipoprotein diacylglycerol transferase
MIDLPFDPDLIDSPVAISWHGVLSAVGIAAGVWLAVRLARSRLPEERAYSIGTWGVIGGIIGARLLHVIDQWPAYARDPIQILNIFNGGIAIVGAVVGGIVVGYMRALQLRAPVGFTADAAAPAIPLGMGIGRIGDIINGEHHAVVCDPPLPWCVRYTHPETLGQGPFAAGPARLGPNEYVHPAVAYEMLLDFAIVGLLLWLRPRVVGRQPEGRLLWLFLALYGAGRFAISFLRFDAITMFGLRQAQLLSLAMLAASLVMLAYLIARGARAPARP